MRASRNCTDDTGSAVVEFLLVGIPLILLAAMVAQLLFVGYLRNAAMDAASEGASTAALADQKIDAGERQADSVLRLLAVPSDYEIQASTRQISGRQVATVSVNFSSIPGILPIHSVSANSEVWLENQTR